MTESLEQIALRIWGELSDYNLNEPVRFARRLVAELGQGEPVAPYCWIYRAYDAPDDIVSYHILWPGEEQHCDNDPLPLYTRPASPPASQSKEK